MINVDQLERHQQDQTHLPQVDTSNTPGAVELHVQAQSNKTRQNQQQKEEEDTNQQVVVETQPPKTDVVVLKKILYYYETS